MFVIVIVMTIKLISKVNFYYQRYLWNDIIQTNMYIYY